MTTPVRAVAFDMDGLLLNTEHLYDVVIGQLLSELGRKFTRECKMAMMGRPAPIALEILRQRHQLQADWQQLADDIELRFQEVLPEQLELMPGVTQLMRVIEHLHLPMTVATSSRRSFAERALKQVELLDRFEFLICGEEVTEGKPAPEIYLSTASRLQVSPAQMLVLEDSFTGSLAASRAGAITVAVPGEHSRDQDFSHANLVVSRLDAPELAALLAPTPATG